MEGLSLNTTRALRCAVRETRSHEDIVLLPLLFGLLAGSGKSAGTFTELGAYDGQSGSQSWLLEKCFGWSGVLIEASPTNFAMLNNTQRSQQTTKVFSAVCSERGTVDVISSGGTVAGVGSDMAKAYKQRHSRTHTRGCVNKCITSVPCMPLPELISNAGFSQGRVNFLSLDVEGGEERVLQTVVKDMKSPDDFPFDVVLVEADGYDPQKDERVRSMLRAARMRPLPLEKFTGSRNELWAKAHVADLRPPLNQKAHAAASAELRRRWVKPAIRSMNPSPWLADQMNTSSLLITMRLMASMPIAFAQLKRNHDPVS